MNKHTSFDNIDKIPGNKHYTGYTSKGYAREIKKSSGSYGCWVACPHAGEGNRAIPVFAWTLKAMSIVLKNTPALASTVAFRRANYAVREE